MKIFLHRSSGPELFPEGYDLEGVDLERTAQAFDDMLFRRVQEAYPDAHIELWIGAEMACGPWDYVSNRRTTLYEIGLIRQALKQETDWIVWDGPVN
jgi:hypothetical protein